MPTTRPAAPATSTSWVMRTSVRPASWSSPIRRMTSAADFESRLPVGLSARIRSGSVTTGPAHGNALLLAAGELAGPVVDATGQSDAGQGLHRPLLADGTRHAGVDHR